ncbi:response regulator [Nannocystis bainbridge]|uniref:histidine kinase n=1 Tax=Nannocystis bainbridge TaxID=2995303 RepID=A0ABT5DY65_9BACT|nr:response regulator [Nannocystis bainbridge]MDC0717391.1 response regulator [Nannocystis bainbridge]
MEAPVDILLVDDNPNNLLALEALLSDIGAHFVKARSGVDALKCLLEQDFALIILDIQMPDMDGFETAAMIRGRERSRRIPIIFLTAFNRSDTQVHRGYALGAVDFLFKPIVPEILRSKVAVFADLYRKTEEVRRQAEQLRAAERQAAERRLAVAELEARAQVLAEADRRKDEFMAVMAHELRNPLTPIAIALETLRRAQPGTLQLERARQAMERQVQHLVRLVDGLLEASRYTAGTIELRHQPLDVAAVIQQAAQMSQPLLSARQHRLDVQLPEARLELVADPDRVAQMLVNLFNNAARCTDPGGTVTLAVERDGDELEFRVRDNGRGIRPEVLPRIFELFVHNDRARDRAEGGFAVGLAMVKRLAELHGGSVAAHSRGEGQGSEFVIRLPVRAGAPVTAAAPPREVVAPDLSRHILIVDDNPDIRATLADQLELLGHRVEVAESGHEGLERIRTAHPELALIDISLPGLDGYRVAQILQSEPDVRTRLIAMTGYGQPEDRRRSLEAGFMAHLVKPIDLDDLFRLLAT